MIETAVTAREVIELYDALPVQEPRIVAEHISNNVSADVCELKPQAEFKVLVNRVLDKHTELMGRLAQ